MKTTTFGAFALVTLVGIANAATYAPETGLSDPPSDAGTLLVPAGHLIQGQAVDGAWVTSVVPAPSAPMATVAGGVRECSNDIRYEYHWVSLNPEYPLAKNVASEGECGYAFHTSLISLIQYRTSGGEQGEGYLWAEGASASGEFGTYSIICTDSGAALGFPGPTSWSTMMSGRDLSCTYETHGSQPHEWTSWIAWTYNAYWSWGSTYALFA